VSTGEQGNPIRRPNVNQRVKWTKVVSALGLKGLHFHDLRHVGNIWASKAGMSTKDLMARMCHDDLRAALIYQRAPAMLTSGSRTSCPSWWPDTRPPRNLPSIRTAATRTA
jgi:integrase